MIDNITAIDFIGVGAIALALFCARQRFIRWFMAERYDDVRSKIDAYPYSQSKGDKDVTIK